ncbi:putative oxidoreductase Rv2073c [Pseudomonas sp. Bi130]|nr:putative oxidoreductase Rv2073c [Pseudomonas sp. Bi130]
MPLPLVVDLDGTLLRSDLLVETGMAFIRRHPFQLYKTVGWLAQGKTMLESQLASATDIYVNVLPYNAISVVALLTLLGNQFEIQRHGSLAVISSVAGDRGRPSNCLYGTAKAAVSTFCEGLRARLFKVGVSVTTIKLGFVQTPMTKGLNLPPLLIAQPEKVALSIVKAVQIKPTRCTPQHSGH